jgi:broad specificity phosphatase PhoE
VKERKFDVYTGSEPRFEQPTDVLKRAQRCALTLRRECQGQHVVAVTHGDVIAFMMLWAMGRPITPEEKQLLYQSYLDYASITSFTYETILGTEVPEFEYIKP